MCLAGDSLKRLCRITILKDYKAALHDAVAVEYIPLTVDLLSLISNGLTIGAYIEPSVVAFLVVSLID